MSKKSLFTKRKTIPFILIFTKRNRCHLFCFLIDKICIFCIEENDSQLKIFICQCIDTVDDALMHFFLEIILRCLYNQADPSHSIFTYRLTIILKSKGFQVLLALISGNRCGRTTNITN